MYFIKFKRRIEGKSLRKTAKETGHCFRTVKKYDEMDNFNQKEIKRRKRKSKTKKYYLTIRQWLLDDLKHHPKQRHTARRVFTRLKEKYPNFDCSERSIRGLVAEIREEISINSEGYLPLKHHPGEAQVDFGKAEFIEKGIKYNGYYLNMSFPYSNGGYFQLFKSENQECLLQGMKDIFEHIGKVPGEIWFDNASTMVSKVMDKGKRKISEGLYRFMTHYLFTGKFCNPGSGNEKGSVEGKVGYHRRNYLVPIPEFEDIQEFNKEVLKKADEDMNRHHYRKKRSICELFQEELDSMRELPTIPYDVCKYGFFKADKCGRIRFENNSYSTSPKLAGKKVRVKISAYFVNIYDNKDVMITRHKRLYGKGMEAMDWIPYLELLSKRPAAFKYTDIYEQLPGIVRTYLDNADYEMKKEVLGLMSEIAMYKNMSTAVEVLRGSVEHNISNIEEMRSIFYSICSQKPEPKKVTLSSGVPALKEYVPDLKVYDKLFPGKKGGEI